MPGSGVVEVVVRAMTGVEFDRWRQRIAEQYAAEQVAAGLWSPHEALDLAVRGNDALLPDGLGTAGMLLLTGVRGDGTRIRVAWMSLAHPRGTPGVAFLYDIEVEAEHRGAGYGRALLTAAEDTARAHGATGLELNVFGTNTRAITLYASAGYTVVTQQMRKTWALGPGQASVH